MATGATMHSAVETLKQSQPARIIIAVPIAAESTCAVFNTMDSIVTCVCLETPESFIAVALWYEDFPQLTDEDVRELLGSMEIQQPSLLKKGGSL
jgi:putative phosphoribosyl transferase